MAADAASEFFQELGRRGHEPLLGRAKRTLRFDLVDGRRTDHWLVTWLTSTSSAPCPRSISS